MLLLLLMIILPLLEYICEYFFMLKKEASGDNLYYNQNYNNCDLCRLNLNENGRRISMLLFKILGLMSVN